MASAINYYPNQISVEHSRFMGNQLPSKPMGHHYPTHSLNDIQYHQLPTMNQYSYYPQVSSTRNDIPAAAAVPPNAHPLPIIPVQPNVQSYFANNNNMNGNGYPPLNNFHHHSQSMLLPAHHAPPPPPPPGLLFNNNNNNNGYQNNIPIMQPPAQINAAKSEKVNGGVSQVLDYDIKLMSEFFVKNAYIAFGTSASLINENSGSNQTADIFIKGIHSVLNATRLPSVSIFLAIDYLFKYIDKLSAGIESIGGNTVNVIYQNSMIAFILANKFNDDKTFTNKSWSQATGMDIQLINEYERTWLNVFEWSLFDDKFMLYEDLAFAFKMYCQDYVKSTTPQLPSIQHATNSMYHLPSPSSTNNYTCLLYTSRCV